MQNISLYDFMVFFIPLISSVFMLTLLGWDILACADSSRKPKLWLFCSIFVCMLTILLILLYLTYPGVYAYFNWFYSLILLLYPVFFYHFIFDITRTSTDSHFSYRHYLFPVFVAACMLVLQLVVPYSEQLQVIANKKNDPPSLFGIAFYSKPLLKFVYEIVYLVACVRSLRRYRRFIINYASNERKSSLRWIRRYLETLVVPIGCSLLMIIFPYESIVASSLALTPVLFFPFLQVFLVYHTIMGDYIIAENAAPPPPAQTELPDGILKKSILSRTFFEDYISSRQPYLNPDLKITDLVDDLQVNRTYISGFINSEYNMNFSQYINMCRLREYYRIRTDPAFHSKSTEELYTLAGFSNYRYFLRIEKELAKTPDNERH